MKSSSELNRSAHSLWFPARLWIDGQWQESAAKNFFEVSDPATGNSIVQLPLAGAPEAEHAVRAASIAFASWRRTTAHERARILRRIRDLLVEHRDALAQLRTLEQGAPVSQGRAEVEFAADYFRWFSEESLRVYGRSISHPDPLRRLRVEYAPVGVVGAITPWNAPISTAARKVAPALAAGCTVVLKPSELTPLTSLALAWITQEAGLPAGVFNVIFGKPEEIGKVLLEDDAVRMITFTGSVRTGRHLAAEAGRELKRVSLELGGNAPFIVFSDANLQQACDDLVRIKCVNSGQICISPNRVLVEESVQKKFIAMVVDRVKGHRLGHGLDSETTMGPMIHPEAVRKIAGLVEDALSKGAQLVYQERVPDQHPERFYPPTVLDRVHPSMPVARQEVFGPVISFISFRDAEEALRIANDTEYGLAAYVYTSNLARAQNLADRLEFGMVGLNDPRPLIPEAPFGGLKKSGWGREGGHEGLLEFLDVRLIGTRAP